MDRFYFGNDLHAAVVGLEDLADLFDVFGRARKGRGDEIIAHAASELDVGAVLLADKRHGQVGAGQVHALVVGDRAAVDDCADDLGIGLGIDAQADQAVIDQDHAADADISRKVRISYGCSGAVAHHFLSSQGKCLPLFEHDLSTLKVAQPDLGSLGVQKRGHRLAHLAAHADYSAELCFMLLMRSV